MKQHLVDLVEQRWLSSQVVQTNHLEMSLASQRSPLRKWLIQAPSGHLCHLHQRGGRWGHQTRFSRTSFFTPVSSDWNMECTFWIYPPVNLWSFAGNSLRGWGWCQISFHVIQTLKTQNGNSEMSPIRPCHPSFHPVPPAPPRPQLAAVASFLWILPEFFHANTSRHDVILSFLFCPQMHGKHTGVGTAFS